MAYRLAFLAKQNHYDKDRPLVVVVTATAYNTPYAHPQVDRMMEEFILPAVPEK